MNVTTISRNRHQADAEYRHRMVVNLLAASFITMLMIAGYWVVTTLTGAV
jgi:hypothetical protein